MTKDIFKKLQIGNIIYNKKTNVIAILNSQWGGGDKEPGPDLNLGTNVFFGAVNTAYLSIAYKNCEDWEHFDVCDMQNNPMLFCSFLTWRISAITERLDNVKI